MRTVPCQAGLSLLIPALFVGVALAPSAVWSAVSWSFTDNIVGCPAGDTVIVNSVLPVAPFPARLRIAVTYTDASGQPKNGVPPESVWVDVQAATGNVVFNDQSNGLTGFKRIFADDSTRTGDTRITAPSLSGCGTATLKLYVSGVFQGTKTATIRTTDTDADGRVTSADFVSPCDLNYDNVVDSKDVGAVEDHVDHWRRNALHGTLVQRTNYCETCLEGTLNTKGDSQIFWSPSGRFVSHTAFVDAGPGNPASCKVFIVASDPAEGDGLVQVTSDPIWYHDYDPSWSPLNTELVFDRGDSVIMRRTLPWLGSSEFVVTSSSNSGCGPLHGDDIPSVSPDGQWVVFSRCNGAPTGGWSLWKKRIKGGAATQLTPTVGRTDFYASWSPDGQTVYFQRLDGAIGPQWTAWEVPANGGTAQQVFVPAASPDTFDIVQPASSPDGAILTAGFGKRDFVVRRVVTNTLDPGISSPSSSDLIPNYADTSFADKGDFPILSPRLSPDGTRLALGSKQVWAARRNMDKPPVFTTVGGTMIADTTAVYSINATVGTSVSVQVSATDPESDPLTYKAFFLQPGMTFDSTTRTLSWPSVPSPGGVHYYVKFRVSDASGGTDAVILDIRALLPLSSGTEALESTGGGRVRQHTNGELEWDSPFVSGALAQARIFDLAGRRVAQVRGPAGSTLLWDGRDASGRKAPEGVYLYTLSVSGRVETRGRLSIVR